MREAGGSELESCSMRKTSVHCVNGTGAVCDQKTSKFFVSHWKESMARHVGIHGVYYKLWKGNTKESMMRPRWKPEAKCVCSSGAFKTYDNQWEGENKEFPTQ
jgi:hypothetical protein